MGKTTFQVTINDIRASNLTPRDGNSNDPFVKIDFDGEKFKTETLKRTCNPKWRKTKNFFWSTNVVHRLAIKSMKIECYDHNLASSNIHIGTASVDLFTLATGPKHVTLTLFSRSAEKTGTVSFNIGVSQVVQNFTCQLSNVSLANWTGGNPNVSPSLVLDYCFSEDPNSKVFSSVANGTQWPSNLKPIKTKTDAATIYETRGAVQCRITNGITGQGTEIGRCQLPIYQYICPEDERPVPFTVPVTSSMGVIGQLVGDIHLIDGPKFLQMPGDRQMSNLLDRKVTFTGKVLKGFPHPVGYVPPRENNAIIEQQENKVDQFAPPSALQQPQAQAMVYYTETAPDELRPQIPLDTFKRSRDGAMWLAPRKRMWMPYDDDEPLPRNWMISISPDGFAFFKYKPTRQTTWQDPRFLPDGWEQSLTSSGELFWVHNATNGTSWIDPRGLPEPWVVDIADAKCTLVFGYFDVLSNLIQTPIDPRGLPPYYTQHIKVADPARPGKVYYKDHSTRKTDWVDPRAKFTAQQRLEHRIRERKTWDEEQWARVSREKRQRSALTPFEEEQEMIIAIYQTQVDDIQESRKRWFRRQEQDWKLELATLESKYADQLSVYTRQKQALLAKLRNDMQEWHRKEMEAMERRRADVRMSQEVEINMLENSMKGEMGGVLAKKQKDLDAFNAKKAAQLAQRLTTQTAQERKLKDDLDSQLLDLERRFANQIDQERKQKEAREHQAEEAHFEEQRRYQASLQGNRGQQQQQQQPQQQRYQQQQQPQQRYQQQQQQQMNGQRGYAPPPPQFQPFSPQHGNMPPPPMFPPVV